MCMSAKSLQSCPILCNLMEYSPPVSLVHGILQARIPEWVAIPFSRGSSQPRDWTHVSLCLLHWQVGSLPLAPPESPTAWLEGWNSQPSPQPPGRRQALKVESIPSGQWLNQACLCCEASVKTQRMGFRELLRLLSMWQLGRGWTWGGHGAPCPFFTPCTVCLSHLDLPEVHSFTIFLF